MDARTTAPTFIEAQRHPVPDQHGANLYTTDPGLRDLLSVYLPAPLLAHLEPQFQRLGALAGGHLDELASTADKNPPELAVRTRTGIDAQRIVKHPAYVEMERLAFRDFALAAISHRQDVLGWEGQRPIAILSGSNSGRPQYGPPGPCTSFQIQNTS